MIGHAPGGKTKQKYGKNGEDSHTRSLTTLKDLNVDRERSDQIMGGHAERRRAAGRRMIFLKGDRRDREPFDDRRRENGLRDDLPKRGKDLGGMKTVGRSDRRPAKNHLDRLIGFFVDLGKNTEFVGEGKTEEKGPNEQQGSGQPEPTRRRAKKTHDAIHYKGFRPPVKEEYSRASSEDSYPACLSASRGIE